MASTWPLSSACLAALVSSNTAGSSLGLMVSRIAVNEVVPVWAPSLYDARSARLVALVMSSPSSAIRAWAAE